MGNEFYKPEEDTFLLAEILRNERNKIVLEIGVGSGYVIYELAKKNKLVVGTEIDKKTLVKTRKNLDSQSFINRIELVLCDASKAFRNKCFDLITFNPPYLPSDKIVDVSIDGGKGGLEVVEKFIKYSIKLTHNKGKIIFILSSVVKYDKLLKKFRRKNFFVKKLERRKLFFEEIFGVEISKMEKLNGS